MGAIELMEDAAKERLWSYAVGIENGAIKTRGTDPATGLGATELSSPGTGVAGVWHENYFILTAKHVLDKAVVGDLRFFVRQAGEMKAKHASQITMADAIAALPLADPNALIHRCSWEDLALLTIEADALGQGLEFFRFDARGAFADPIEGQRLASVGYPVSAGVHFQQRVARTLHKAVLLSPTPFGANVLPRPSKDELRFKYPSFAPARHFLVPFEPAKLGLRPEGISGAAVWALSTVEHRIWAARFRFAGICTSCYRKGTVEQVVRASSVKRFLHDVFGTTAVKSARLRVTSPGAEPGVMRP